MTLQAEKHHNWKGGRYIDSAGYVTIRVGLNTYRREHRVVMEQMLGRPLAKHESVHHKNGNKQDNRPENLELLTKSSHTKHHWDTGDFARWQPSRPMAACHPDRPHYARGMCKLCYRNEAQKKYVAEHHETVLERKKRARQTEEALANRRAYRKKRYQELREQGYSADEIRRLA